MRRIRIAGALLLALAALGASALAGSASAGQLVFRTASGPVRSGSLLNATSHNLVLSSETLTVECATSEFRGTLESNSTAEDLILFYDWSAFGSISEPGGYCGNAQKVEFRLNNNFGIHGKFKPSGSAKILPSSEEGEYILELLFSDSKVCVYTNKVLNGKLAVGKPGAPVPAVMKFSKQSWKRGKSTNEHPGCPTKLLMGGEFAMTTEGVPVDAES